MLSGKWQIVNICKKLTGLIPDFFNQYNPALRPKISIKGSRVIRIRPCCLCRHYQANEIFIETSSRLYLLISSLDQLTTPF